VRIVLAQSWLAGYGGSETYLLTVAEQLTRLGHDVTVHGRELGDMAEFMRNRGVSVASEAELPPECDAILTQDGVTAYALAARYPDTPNLFVMHSTLFDMGAPPQIDGVASAVVVMSERYEERVQAMVGYPEIVRLRQPVDLRRFSPRGDICQTPKRALLLGNHLFGHRYEMVVDACSALDIERRRTGLHGRPDPQPEESIVEADIVIGAGRCIIEAMSCGRAAFVYDQRGGQGWVTPESYPTLEADGFTGQGTDHFLDGDGLKRALAEYRPEMGLVNRELARTHHGAHLHAQELVALLRQLAPRSEPAVTPLREMARLVELSWRHEATAAARETEAWQLRQRAGELERHLEVLRASRRYRLGSLLAKPLDLWRRIRGSYSQEP
jgi:hypothetical protein